MARICDKCGREPLQVLSRSHSHIATKRRQHVNLQFKRIDGKRQRLCTKCIKTATKVAQAA